RLARDAGLFLHSFPFASNRREAETLAHVREPGKRALLRPCCLRIHANLRRSMSRAHFADRTEWNLAQNRLSQALAQHRAAGKPVLDLTASNPTQCGFHYDEKAILAALCNREAMVYRPEPMGLETARRAVAEYYAAGGDRVLPDDILLTSSTSEAYS